MFYQFFFIKFIFSNLLNLACLYSYTEIFFLFNLTLDFGNTLCFMLVKMIIKVSQFLLGLENGFWFNLVVKSIFCSSIRKLSNFSFVFDSISMYLAGLLLRKYSFEYV